MNVELIIKKGDVAGDALTISWFFGKIDIPHKTMEVWLMKLSVKEFLNTVQNPNTRKGYRQGIKKFCEYYGKTAEEILNQRKDDLTQRTGENLIEYKNRAARFSKEIEKFHSHLLDNGFSTNSARNFTIGIRQLFRFYQMPVQIRAGSKVTKTVKTSKSFPLRIEHVRKMFAIADIRERVILSMATDLGLRIGDFIKIKKDDLPPLDQEIPIPFGTMTGKEEVVAHGFLSQETVDLLKAYIPTLTKKGNPYLFPSNGKSHISDEWLSKLLKRLAKKAKIPMNKKSLTFHCFRKMLLSASIDSGIGLTAGKKLVGKAIAQSDDTYLTTINLRNKFIQLKNFQTIEEQPKIETENIEALKKAISKLQEDLTTQKTITDVITRENQEIKKQFVENEKELNMVSETIMNRIIPIVDLFDSIEGLEEFLKQFKSKKTKMTTELEQKLAKELIEARKKREEHIARRAQWYLDALEKMEKESKEQDKTG
jgi:integrase